MGTETIKAWLNEETLLRRQMFPSLAARETCCGNKLCCSETKNGFA